MQLNCHTIGETSCSMTCIFFHKKATWIPFDVVECCLGFNNRPQGNRVIHQKPNLLGPFWGEEIVSPLVNHPFRQVGGLAQDPMEAQKKVSEDWKKNALSRSIEILVG